MQYSWIRPVVLLTALFTISWIPLQAQQSSLIQQARQHLVDNGDRFGVPAGTAHTARISSSHTSNVSGITYVYFKQTVDGIDVNGGDITMALKADGSLFLRLGTVQSWSS